MKDMVKFEIMMTSTNNSITNMFSPRLAQLSTKSRELCQTL
jgi:hypothetical protein